MNGDDLRATVEREGFALVRRAVPHERIMRIRSAVAPWIAAIPPIVAYRLRYQGSDIPVHAKAPLPAALVEHFTAPATWSLLRSAGASSPRLLSAYVVDKPAGGPPLFWHQDWPFWSNPASGEIAAPMLGLMLYLGDTSATNGCLRVLPGSHRRRLPLHADLPTPHSPAAYDQPRAGPAFVVHPDERDVPVALGDLVVVDARLLHAAHANGSEINRTCLTTWFIADFDGLGGPLKSAIARLEPGVARFSADHPQLAAHLPPGPEDGDAEPATFERAPGRWLKP